MAEYASLFRHSGYGLRARFDRQIFRRALFRGLRSGWKHSPMRIADPFFTIAHVIGSLPAVDDSTRWDRSDRPSSGLLLRQPVRVAEAARAAVIAAPAADAACTFRLKNK